MARASRVYSLSICNSGVGRGGKKPRGSRSPSRYPHWRKALNTLSRSGLLAWFDDESTTAAPAEVLDFGVDIYLLLG